MGMREPRTLWACRGVCRQEIHTTCGINGNRNCMGEPANDAASFLPSLQTAPEEHTGFIDEFTWGFIANVLCRLIQDITDESALFITARDNSHCQRTDFMRR